MPKQLLLIAIFILTAVWLRAQDPTRNPYADSLFQLSDYYSDKDSAKAVGYINDYFRQPNNTAYYDAVAHFYLAGAYFDFDLARAQEEYMSAVKLLNTFSTREAILYRSRAWHNYAVLEQKKDDNRSFIDIQLNKAIPLALQAGDTSRVAWNYKEVGMVFMNFEEYPKALEYYHQALGLLRPTAANQEQIADCYVNIAKAWLLQDSTQPARKPLDSAEALLRPQPNSTFQALRYLVEGMYHSHTSEWKKGIDSLDKGLKMAKAFNRTYDEYSILYEKYTIYRKQKNYTEARSILGEVYAFNEQHPLSHNKRLILYELAQTEAALGHPDSAYKWMFEYAQLSDSVARAGTTLQIADLEAKYRSSEKERELLELGNRSKVQRLLLSGGILLLAIGLLFFVYRSRQRKLQTEQAVRSLQQQQQIEITGALLNGEERERQRLARELHDGLGGMLAGIRINLSGIGADTASGSGITSGEGQDNPTLHKAIRQLDNSIKELRHIAHNLMPESLIRFSLEVALRDLCESLGNQQTKVELQMMNIGDIAKQTQLIIYRIIQELLANVLKHAHASEVFVQCSQSENIFYITVEDDGVGIDKGLTDNPKGIGLENIRRRVEYLKGRLEIDSPPTPGKGTIINIEIHVA
jgi:signal transduction histidine kinase